MKKILAIALAMTMALCAFAFADEEKPVMTYADYVAAEVDTEVTVVTYVQATQSWWDGKITMYTQDADGAYFAYNCACTEEDAAKLVPGTKICLKGFKSVWEGEAEIVDGTFTFVEDGETFLAAPVDVTAAFGTEQLVDFQNRLFCVKGAVVAPAAEDGDAAFLYKWDGSGADGDDLYFKVTIGEATYTFTVESYLCGAGTEVYEAVKALKVGDTVDVTGFLYWYQGVNPHVTSVVPAA